MTSPPLQVLKRMNILSSSDDFISYLTMSLYKNSSLRPATVKKNEIDNDELFDRKIQWSFAQNSVSE
jgi:D-lyxose ketol-isomerase